MSAKTSLKLPKDFGDELKSLGPGEVFELTSEAGTRYVVLRGEEFDRLMPLAGMRFRPVT